MRKWNKLLALVLAMVMVFGLTATSFAAEEDKTEEPKTEAADDAQTPDSEHADDDKTPAEGEDKTEAPAEGEDKTEAPAEGEDKTETPDEGEATPIAELYADVADWAKEAVAAVVEKKLIDMGETSFNPGESMTRGVLVEALYRLAEKPALAEDAEVKTFSDVAEDSAVAASVAWASATGVVAGYDDGTFQPDKAMNRAEIAAVLFRYAEAEAVAEDNLAAFPDADKVQNWAKDALNWAVANKLITGNGDKLDPAGTATRQQVALILNRYINEVLTAADDAAPAEGEDKTEAPAEGEDKTEAPAEGEDNKTEAPAEGEDKTEAPAEGEDKTEAPAEGEDKTEAPAEGEDKTEAPTEGEDKTETPAEGEDKK